MAAFLYRLAGSPKFDEKQNPFADVTKDTPHYKEILWLAATGISTGWPDHTFRGMDTVKRQDMAAFLHRLADYRKAKPKLGNAISFKDVNASTPHRADIIWLTRTGVTTGWKNGTFRGMNAVIRQDMAAFLQRMKTNVLDAKSSDVKPAVSAKIREAGDGWAIDRDGYLWTWGDNEYGQVGDGTTNTRLTPYKVQGPKNVKTYNDGYDGHYVTRYAITANGELWTWGDNSYGQVGNGGKTGIGTDSWLTPYKVPLPMAVKDAEIRNGAMYAVTVDGRLWAWGDNLYGQLGDPSAGEGQTTPHQVPGLTGVTLMDAPLNVLTMFVTTGDGSLWAWGDGGAGTVGDGHSGELRKDCLYACPYYRATPYRVPGPTHVRRIMADDMGFTVYAIDGDGNLWAWGNNHNGEIGDGTRQGDDDGSHATPYKVQGPTHVRSVTVGGSGFQVVLAVDGDGGVWTWGSGANGQLGNGDYVLYQLTPYKVQGPTNVGSASVDGMGTAYAVDGAGDLWLWGRWGDRLASGYGDDALAPLKVPDLHGVTSAVTDGFGMMSVTTRDGALWRWGRNDRGQVGDGTKTDWRRTPYRLNDLTGVSASDNGLLTQSSTVNHAISGDGNLWTWGQGLYGEVGDGSTKNRLAPYKVSGPAKVKQVMYHEHSLFDTVAYTVYALTEDGNLWSWGYNKEGAVGDGTTTNRLTPYKLQFK
ncbi:S-layer homology domain-containing protein [Bifidobacterium ramosum]|nr:S-layer homology domain-containing protein [Bifidobacterium ramosum]